MKNWRRAAVPLISAIPIVLMYALIKHSWPELLTGSSATVFSTYGTLVTFYGGLVAVVEIIRTKLAAERAYQEASRAIRLLGNVGDVQNIVECKCYIGASIAALEAGIEIPPQTLNEIIGTYSEIFHTQIASDDQAYANNRAQLYSYKSGSESKLLRERTITALRKMLGQFSELIAKKLGEVRANVLVGGDYDS